MHTHMVHFYWNATLEPLITIVDSRVYCFSGYKTVFISRNWFLDFDFMEIDIGLNYPDRC